MQKDSISNKSIFLNYDSEDIISLEEEEDQDETSITKNNTKTKKNHSSKNGNIVEIDIKLDSFFDPDEKFIETKEEDITLLNKKRKSSKNNKSNKKEEKSERMQDDSAIKQKNKVISNELQYFYKLVEKYGLEKVLSSLCQTENNSKELNNNNNDVDNILNTIEDTWGKNKFINNVISTLFSLLNDNDNKISDNLYNFNNVNQQRIIFNNKNKGFNFNIEFNKNNIIEIPVTNEEEKNIKKISFCSFYSKNEEGKIYKYENVYFLEGIIVYKCCDDDCNGNGIFDINTKKFKIQDKHNKNYYEHNFSKNGEFENDIWFKELNNNSKYNDAQILLDDVSKTVKFYC